MVVFFFGAGFETFFLLTLLDDFLVVFLTTFFFATDFLAAFLVTFFELPRDAEAPDPFDLLERAAVFLVVFFFAVFFLGKQTAFS